MASASNLSALHTPVRVDVNVAPGHVAVNSKWTGTVLANTLKQSVNVIFDPTLGIIDFHPTPSVGMIYISEADLIVCHDSRRKLAMLRKYDSLRGVVMVERCGPSEQYFSDMQNFAVIELGLHIIPVGSQTEAAGVLSAMVKTSAHNSPNPFRPSKGHGLLAQSVLQCLQVVPGLGEVKAKALLQRFGTIAAVCDATQQELTEVVGVAQAKAVRDFFR